ncbi:MAG: TIM barrel protein [Streptosporangiales bacterium]|nr:TIM barrel protein [Streptosporangiales bacterium]
MKHPKYAVNLSILFTELPLLERPAAARAAGFDAAEFWWPFAEAVPGDAEVDGFVSALADAGLALVGLNFYAGDMPGGQRGILSLPGRSAEFRDSVAVLAGIAERTGCRGFNALYGQRVGGVAAEEQDAIATENLVHAAAAVRPLGGTVLIESLTEGENGPYPLLTAADSAAVCDRVREADPRASPAVLFDAYHLANNGEDLHAVIETYADRIGHVQIADRPGRHQPGTGETDFPALFAKLAEHGYDGYVACEYKPDGPSADSFGWLPAEHRASGAGKG